MADQSTDIKPYHGTNRSKVAYFVSEGMRDKDIAAMLGITRQRFEQLRKAQGLTSEPTKPPYPREKGFVSQRNGGHTFLELSPSH